MADLTRLLAGETLEDVAEHFDSGLSEKHQETADHLRSGKFENVIKKANACSAQQTAQMAASAKKGKGYLVL